MLKLHVATVHIKGATKHLILLACPQWIPYWSSAKIAIAILAAHVAKLLHVHSYVNVGLLY